MNSKKIDSQDLYQEYANKSFLYYQGDRAEILPYIPKNSNCILDVGCSCGGFGELLKSKGFPEVWGVEIFEPAASIAAEKLDQVICGSFESSLQLPINKFDCITFNDVLEHIVDPFEALRYCHNLLTSEGVVVACIPNVRHFYTIWELVVDGDWQYKEGGVLDKTHLRFFTRKSILSTFSDLGYSIEKIQGINPVHSRKFSLLNFLTLRRIEDMRYQQFIVVARPSKDNVVVSLDRK